MKLKRVKSIYMIFNVENANLDGPRIPGMSLFEYIHRSNRPEYDILRKRVNDWASRFPIDSEFLSRFKDKEDRQHYGAFFELFIHEFLTRLGYTVKRGQPLGEGKNTEVDFIVFKNKVKQFYLECTLASDSMTDPSISKIESQIEKAVEEIDSPNFYFRLYYLKRSKREPSKKIIKKCVAQLLDGGYDKREGFVEINGWRIQIILIERVAPQKNNLKPFNVGSTSEGVKFNPDPYPQFYSALNSKKPSKYGQFDRPYVIAINSNEVTLNDNELVRILYGLTPGQTKIYPKKSGFLYNGKPINTPVSAIMVFTELFYFYLNPLNSAVWENPWAKFPLDENIQLWIDHIRMKNFGPNFVLQKTPGKAIIELMK